MPNFEKYQIGNHVRWQNRNNPTQWNEGIITNKLKDGRIIMKTIRSNNDPDRHPNFEWYDTGFSLIKKHLPIPVFKNTVALILAKNGKQIEIRITRA